MKKVNTVTTESGDDLHRVLDRLKLAFGVRTQGALAKLLGMTDSALSMRLARASLPWPEIVKSAADRGVDLTAAGVFVPGVAGAASAAAAAVIISQPVDKYTHSPDGDRRRRRSDDQALDLFRLRRAFLALAEVEGATGVQATPEARWEALMRLYARAAL